MEHLIGHYMDLRAANARGFRFEPISYSEILAYKQLIRVELDPWEVDMIRVLDVEWIGLQPEDPKPPSR